MERKKNRGMSLEVGRSDASSLQKRKKRKTRLTERQSQEIGESPSSIVHEMKLSRTEIYEDLSRRSTVDLDELASHEEEGERGDESKGDPSCKGAENGS